MHLFKRVRLPEVASVEVNEQASLVRVTYTDGHILDMEYVRKPGQSRSLKATQGIHYVSNFMLHDRKALRFQLLETSHLLERVRKGEFVPLMNAPDMYSQARACRYWKAADNHIRRETWWPRFQRLSYQLETAFIVVCVLQAKVWADTDFSEE